MISLKIAHHKIVLWIIAFVITVGLIIYQRITGPTYPNRGKLNFQQKQISFKLLRSKTVNQAAPIVLTASDTTIGGYVKYVRYKSHDEWTELPMLRENDKLKAYLPPQPPAGKLMYFVYVTKNDQTLSLTGDDPIILRYRGEVPAFILLAHVLIIFLAILFSNRAGLESLDATGKADRFIIWTIALFFVGGLILGPLMQKYAFGEWWTGFPVGKDLTDTKTLFAMLGWLWAWYKNLGEKKSRGWIIFAALLMLAVYLIPHSVLGSELDYTKLPEAH